MEKANCFTSIGVDGVDRVHSHPGFGRLSKSSCSLHPHSALGTTREMKREERTWGHGQQLTVRRPTCAQGWTHACPGRGSGLHLHPHLPINLVRDFLQSGRLWLPALRVVPVSSFCHGDQACGCKQVMTQAPWRPAWWQILKFRKNSLPSSEPDKLECPSSSFLDPCSLPFPDVSFPVVTFRGKGRGC